MKAKEYRPRRAGKRWLEGAPAEVLDVFDAGDKFADRYTVFFGGKMLILPDEEQYAGPGNVYVPYLGMSENPSHPQGVGMWDEMRAYEASTYRYKNGRQRIKWADLPDKVQDCVRRSIGPARKSEILRKLAQANGFRVTDIPLIHPAPGELIGLPQLRGLTDTPKGHPND